MGDAARKLSKTKELLQAHPWCIYCGVPATTTDHCPPRSFFKSRQWPDTYEYPACEPCNRSARLDEQALATLIRADTLEGATDTERLEWERLATGVKNNQPHLVAEWESISRNQIKHSLRLAYGREGDLRRQRGWGALNIGPLTHAVIERFMIKLSKALYYRHNEKIFDGVLYIHHINRLSMDTTPEYLKSIYHMAPALPEIKRNGKSLFDQFVYRFNHSPEHKVMYAVVQFGQQWIFQLIAVSREMDAQLIAASHEKGDTGPLPFRHECFLSAPDTHAQAAGGAPPASPHPRY
jgi:hypothetical protein